jgi:hypothetical protein
MDSDCDFDNSGSGLTFAVPFFCKICLKAVAFSGENPGEHPIFTAFLLVGVEVVVGFDLTCSGVDTLAFSVVFN